MFHYAGGKSGQETEWSGQMESDGEIGLGHGIGEGLGREWLTTADHNFKDGTAW